MPLPDVQARDWGVSIAFVNLKTAALRREIDTTALPRYRTDEHEALVDRWMNTVGKLPD